LKIQKEICPGADWEFMMHFVIIGNPRGAPRFYSLSIRTEDICTIGIEKFTIVGNSDFKDPVFGLVLEYKSKDELKEISFGCFEDPDEAQVALELFLERHNPL